MGPRRNNDNDDNDNNNNNSNESSSSGTEGYDEAIGLDEHDPVLVDNDSNTAGRDTINRSRQMRPRRVALVVAVLVSDLFFTGLVFGWPSLLLMLKEEHQFRELCSAGETSCSAQTNHLNLMFTMGAAVAIAFALPIGLFLDSFGPKITIAIAATLEISGLILLGTADSKTFDVFVISFMLLALGGCVTMMASYPVSFLMLQYQTAILASISCLFDACCAVFLLLFWIRSLFGVSRKSLFIGYAVFGCVVYAALVVLWYLNEKSFGKEQRKVLKRQQRIVRVDGVDEQESGNASSHGSCADGDPMNQKIVTEFYSQYGTLGGGALMKQPHISAVREACVTHLKNPEMGTLTAKDQLRTFEFGFLVVFGAIHVFRCTLYIGSINQMLENYGDETYHFVFAKLFNFVLSLGFVFLPAIDYVMESKGLGGLLRLTNFFGLLYNLWAFVPMLGLQPLGFMLFTGFRALLYAVLSAFAAKTFGLRNLGTITGTVSSAAALVNLFEYPALYIADGKTTGLLVFSLVLCMLLVPLTEYQKRRTLSRQRENHQKIIVKLGFDDKTIDSHSPTSIYRGRSPSIKAPGFYSHT